MRDDEAYLLRLTQAIDGLDDEIERLRFDLAGPSMVSKPAERRLPKLAAQIADLHDYFLYLTLDALEDPRLNGDLVRKLELCERESRTHAKFFFTLAQLLSVKHRITEVPGEAIKREEFERSWARTARELGLE